MENITDDDFRETEIDKNLDSIILEFEKEAGGYLNAGENKENISNDQDFAMFEGIELDDLLEICPPDLLRSCLSPSQSLAYISITKDLAKDQATRIKPYFVPNDQIFELRKKIITKMIEQKFPNLKGKKLPPLTSFFILEFFTTLISVKNAKNDLAEEAFLKGASNESN